MNLYSTGEIAERINIPTQTLQTWLKRFPDLITSVNGGGKPGKHRVFQPKTVMQLAVVAHLREGGFTWPLKRMMEIGRIVSEYNGDVRIHDGVHVLVTPTETLVGPRDHRMFFTDNGIPRAGAHFDQTDLHREFFGPHKPRDPETANERRRRLGFSEAA